MSDGARIHPDLPQAVVPTGLEQLVSMQIQGPQPLEFRLFYLYMCIFHHPDTWEHVGAAEEVEVHGGPGSGPGFAGAYQDPGEHRLRRDQTGPSSPEDSPDADGGSLCLRPVLPANQRAQCHEKVISPGPHCIPDKKPLQHRRRSALRCTQTNRA